MKQLRVSVLRLSSFLVAAGFLLTSTPVLAQRPLGIDVSSYQGSGVNWSTVKSDGIVFAWAKAAEGTATDGWVGEDPDFTINEANARAAGVYIGAYYYAHPETDEGLAGADAEAAFFCQVAGPDIKNGGYYLMPMLDFEQDVTSASPAYTATTLSQWANEWCQDVVNYAASNGVVVKPVVYTYVSYAAGTSGNGPGLDSTVTQWPLDMANTEYTDPQTGAPSGTSPWSNWNFWQYNTDTAVSGVPNGDCDQDVFDGTLATLTNLEVIGNGAAALYYWDPQGTAGGDPYTGSMTGTWESKSWSTGSGGMATPTSWFEGQAVCFGVNTGNGTPAFTVTANTNHVFAGMFDGPLNPDSCNVTINGNGILSLASGAQGFDLINASDGSLGILTISNRIAGTGQMVPEGNGQLTLDGTNTFTGGLALGYTSNPFSGTINFNNGSAFGSGLITLQNLGNGTTLQAKGTAAMTITNPVTVASATTNIIIGNAAGVTFSGSWSLGANAFTLNTGPTAANVVGISGVISGTAAFTVTNLGTLALGGANTYSGATIVSSGTLRLTGANAVPSGSSLFLANSAKFDMNGFSDSIATITGVAGATQPNGNIINNNGTLTFNGTSVANAGEEGSSAYSGVISGSGNVVVSGGGSTTLSGLNTYGGSTTVSGGTLVPSRVGAIPAASAIAVNSPGVFELASVNETISSLTGSGTVNLESATLTVSNGVNFSGVIQNAAAAYNNGASVSGLQGFYFPAVNFSGTPVIRVDSTVNFTNLTLSNEDPLYPTDTEFSIRWLGQVRTTSTAGTYTFSTTSDDGSRVWVNGVLVVDNWAFQGATTRSGTISLSANTLYDICVEYMQGGGGASCVLNWTPPGGTSVVIPNSNLFTYAGNGGLVKIGSGTLTLSGANTYSGATTISAGTLALGANGSISNSTALSLAAGATLDVSAINAFNLSAATALTASGNSTPATIGGGGTVNLGSQPITLNYDGTHPALTLSQGSLLLGANSFTVNGTQLAGGAAYPIIQQASGIISATGPCPVNGTATGAAGTTPAIAVEGGTVYLVINDVTTTTLSSLSPSTYGQPVTITATVVPAPSGGTMQFYDNSVALGGPVAVAGGAASITITNFAEGSHPITAAYSGITGYAASSTTGPSTQQVNPAGLTITAGAQTKIYGTFLSFDSGSTNFAAAGLQNGETVGTVTLAVSDNGGMSNAPVGTYVITPSAATGGSFNPMNYSIVYGTNFLTVMLAATQGPANASGISLMNNSGGVFLNFTGTPGYTYIIEAADTLSPPDWTAISTNTADYTGSFNYTDYSPGNMAWRFYRTATQ